MKKSVEIEATKKARKQLVRLPSYVSVKLYGWILAIEENGIGEIRKMPSYHDEPLQGKRWGQRSIRLSLAYRAIYSVIEDKQRSFVKILEVSKHDY